MGDRTPHLILNLDKPRTFRFDLNAVIDFQQATGTKLTEFGEVVDKIDEDIRILRTLLWAGLRQEDPELTIEQVGALMTVDKWADLGVKVMDYVKQAMEATEEDLKNVPGVVMEKEKEKKSPGTGTPPSKQPSESESGKDSIS